jgi:two-component sensor histidine kinase
MPGGGANSERVLILAPHGRDSEIGAALLAEAGVKSSICADATVLCAELEAGAALAMIAEEGVAESDLSALSAWVATQPAWSDMPVLLLTSYEDSPSRVDHAARYQDVFGNVTYIERPFHPTTLVSVVRSAIRSRRRQYEARASLDRYMLLARELQHRTKNLLAVIQSIASATLATGSAREVYFARLHALATAQDLVLEGDGSGTSIKLLVEQALGSFGARVVAQGLDVYLSATTAQGLALVLHELATNAVKYGALSTTDGTVAVDWHIEDRAQSILRLRWRERGGPPVTPPTHKGFGTKLLEVAVASAEAPTFEYSTQGFEYQLCATLDGRARAQP